MLTGDRSAQLFGQVARIIAGAIPDADLVVLEGATHATYCTRPKAFAETVRSFGRSLACLTGRNRLSPPRPKVPESEGGSRRPKHYATLYL